MRRIILESPLRGKDQAECDANLQYARDCLLHSLRMGEAPLASHLLYAQVLDDLKEDERELGMNAGWTWIPHAQYMVIYQDRGISVGMRRAIALAKEIKLPIQYRNIR